MLAPTQTRPAYGHAFLDRTKRPGLLRAMVICQFPKFRAEIVKTLQSNFEVDYYASADAAVPALKKGKKPELIVIDYQLMVSGSRSFVKAKLETERVQNVPMLIMGQVEEERFNETVRLACRMSYLRRPFLQSQLRDDANRLINSPVEDTWKNLPEGQKKALQSTARNFRSMAHKVRKGSPINMVENRENCQPLMNEVLDGNASALIENVRDHHDYTYVHSLKAATLLSLLGQAIGIKGHELLTVTTGGMLMDIGKLALPQDLLNMPEQIDQAQMKELKKHVVHSHNILKDTINVGEGVKVIAEQHHEKIDGSGYPFGLEGKDLNELARLSCITDIFCALTDTRPYKPGFDFDTSIKVLEKMEGQLDPFLLKLFKEIVKLVYDEMDEPVVH